MFEFVNARLSISARLTLIGALFCAPIALLIYLFVSQSFSDIDFAKREMDGTRYLADIWPGFVKTATRGAVDNDGDASASAFDAELDTSAASKAYAEAAAVLDKLEAGKTLIGNVADNSNLTLDPDLDSFYAMDAATVRLPGIVFGRCGAERGLCRAARKRRADRRHRFRRLEIADVVERRAGLARGDDEEQRRGRHLEGALGRCSGAAGGDRRCAGQGQGGARDAGRRRSAAGGRRRHRQGRRRLATDQRRGRAPAAGPRRPPDRAVDREPGRSAGLRVRRDRPFVDDRARSQRPPRAVARRDGAPHRQRRRSRRALSRRRPRDRPHRPNARRVQGKP